ncbi:hypothetical protein NC652_013074 [Populus alba x Populus x berolinensis]|nr:hypothetical protein NC651_012715 [Populus alba x Populus x berolinensis]KAJ6929095.1 hypothetical protein NC652_013074 [Populus alba x Populus x berolinensis]
MRKKETESTDNSFLGSQQLLCSVVVPIAMLLLEVSQPVLIGWFMSERKDCCFAATLQSQHTKENEASSICS